MEDYELHEWSECELRGYLCGGISVITPLPAGEGTGEGPAVDGGGASWGRGRDQLRRGEETAGYTLSWQYLASFSLLYTMGKAAAR